MLKKKLQKLPQNLRKKAIREARNQNKIKLPSKSRKRRSKTKFLQTLTQHEAEIKSTEDQLKKILSEYELLADIPYNCTVEELLGEIAIAEGRATTVYVQRDGLSTLTVVLHQENPTIAQLKHTIQVVSVAEHVRTLRERNDERLRRRQRSLRTDSESTSGAGMTTSDRDSQRVRLVPRSTGELVCSVTRNGHQHRSNVSWRFLWRAYTLFNVDLNQVINDENGRASLAELGIENATTLKFCHRVKYFGRKRQK